MSAFVNTPEMDLITAVEEGAEGRTIKIGLPPGYQIQPQTLDGTSNATGYDTLLGCQFDTTSISNADGRPTIEFKSGCRVIEYQEPKSRRQRPIEDPQGDRFVCLWSPCKSTRTFGRVAELQRHYDEQHVRSRVFDCMAVDCPAKGLRGFTRFSKLSIHLQTHHSRNTPFLCPVSQCGAGPFPPELLYVHLNWHKKVWPDYESQRKSLVVLCFSCPVQGCKEDLVSGDRHLSCHDIDTRKRDASGILAAGYSPTSGLPLCPVCNAELGSRVEDQVNTNHLLSHDWESLYNHRREILKVWFNFGSLKEFRHVFEDIMPTVDCRDGGIITSIAKRSHL